MRHSQYDDDDSYYRENYGRYMDNQGGDSVYEGESYYGGSQYEDISYYSNNQESVLSDDRASYYSESHDGSSLMSAARKNVASMNSSSRNIKTNGLATKKQLAKKGGGDFWLYEKFTEVMTGKPAVNDGREEHGNESAFEKFMNVVAFPEKQLNCGEENGANAKVNRRALPSSSTRRDSPPSSPAGQSTFERTMDIVAFPEKHCAPTPAMIEGTLNCMAYPERSLVGRGGSDVRGSHNRHGTRQVASFDEDGDIIDPVRCNPGQDLLNRKEKDALDTVFEGVENAVCRSDNTMDNSYPVVGNDDDLGICQSMSCSELSCTEPVPERSRTDLDLLELPELRRDRSLISEASEEPTVHKAPSRQTSRFERGPPSQIRQGFHMERGYPSPQRQRSRMERSVAGPAIECSTISSKSKRSGRSSRTVASSQDKDAGMEMVLGKRISGKKKPKNGFFLFGKKKDKKEKKSKKDSKRSI